MTKRAGDEAMSIITSAARLQRLVGIAEGHESGEGQYWSTPPIHFAQSSIFEGITFYRQLDEPMWASTANPEPARDTGHVRLRRVEEAVAQHDTRLEALEENAQGRPDQPRFSILNTLDHAQLELRRPLTVTIEVDDDGEATARWDEALLEGTGVDILEALAALREQIVSAFIDMSQLEAEGKSFAGYAARLWRILETFVSSR